MGNGDRRLVVSRDARDHGGASARINCIAKISCKAAGAEGDSGQ